MFFKDKHTRAQESGRTMMEMLAVIGIIGVLSVGGMTMGSRVINAIKANRIVAGVQERILLAQKRRIIGQSTTFRDRRIQEDILGLYPVEYKKGVTDEENSIYYGKKITVSEIPQRVCEALKDDETLKGTLEEVRGIISFNNSGEEGACKEENNEFFVLFGGRSEGKCRGVNNGCLECDDRIGEWVINEAKDGEQIQDICHMCSNGHVVAKEKGKVVPCNGNACCTMFETCDAEEGCVTRCPANSSYNNFSGDQIGDSDCYCNAGYRVDAFQTGCRSEKICNPTCEAPLVCNDGECVCPNEDEEYVPSATNRANMLCCDSELVMNGACCSSVTYDETTGEKLCCGYNSSKNGCCPEGYFAYNNKCYSCEDKTAVYVLQKQYCAMCPNRTQAAHKCYLECPEPDQDNVNGTCYCPDDRPVQDTDGKCHTCDSGKKGVWNVTLSAMNLGYLSKISDVCASAAYCGNYRCTGGYMSACTEGQIGAIWAKPANNFRLKDGTQIGNTNSSAIKCYDCSEVDISTIKFESQCNICGGTWSGENWFTGTCTPPEPECETDEDCGENDCIICDPETYQCINACEPVEYLESSGTQYIDTGLLPKDTNGFQLDIMVTSLANENTPTGCMVSGMRFVGVYFMNAQNRISYGWGTSVSQMSTSFTPNTKYHIETNYKNSRKITFGNVVVLDNLSTLSNNITNTFTLFKRNYGSTAGSFVGRMYNCQVTDGGNVIFDFVPVISPSGEACMFDNVSEKLFCNAGTGSFKTNLD